MFEMSVRVSQIHARDKGSGRERSAALMREEEKHIDARSEASGLVLLSYANGLLSGNRSLSGENGGQNGRGGRQESRGREGREQGRGGRKGERGERTFRGEDMKERHCLCIAPRSLERPQSFN